MQKDTEFVFAEIARFSPVQWDQIPDLGLYMDQVITFITRLYEPLYGETTKGYLSAPMINNYVKNKLIPRPTGKKYSRLQIPAFLLRDRRQRKWPCSPCCRLSSSCCRL